MRKRRNRDVPYRVRVGSWQKMHVKATEICVPDANQKKTCLACEYTSGTEFQSTF